jgi:hypothetical protein
MRKALLFIAISALARLRCARSSVSGRFLIAGLGLAAALALPSAAGAAPPLSPSFQDSAVGSGSTSFFSGFNFNLTSGASGENASGVTTTDGFGEHFEGSSITCLSVSGDTATFAGGLNPNAFGFTHFRVTVVDNGPGNSGLDSYAANGYFGPVDCSAPETSFSATLTSGDIVVVDSPPPPTSKDQCKGGDYQQYGFANEGLCVAFVERGPMG